MHIWRPPRSCCNGWHCCDRPGENLHRSDWSHQTAIQWQHPLDQRGWKTQNGQWLSGQPLPAVTLSQCKSDKETLMLTFHSVCLGRGIPGQNPLLWPERKSLHRFGYQPGDRWWKSFSKWTNWPLRRLFSCLLQPAPYPVFTRVSAASCVTSVAQAPVVLSRDHHDVSGTDSPFRETSNVYDGSAFCAGMWYAHYGCT